MSEQKPQVRCAIYTRKSSEEGLEQSFNSLHAQREACQAYIVSQRHEGWRALETKYDDGGFSGGSLERPAVKRLLADIEAKKIDTVVVYKVDRLTRSLADFAKIVEAFDQRGVSFVSVTQQFNTTSSMGRLTLNVLLSFAQFEREVTGERIRDKIAASKRKGLWMGGRVPLGYDLRDRRLVIHKEEAERVNKIYKLYLKLGCVAKLKAYLDQKQIKSKIRVSRLGRTSGGASYSRGALYELLANPLYVGEIRHKKEFFRGEHEAIVGRDLWDKVQAKLKANVHARRSRTNSRETSLLRGLLYDDRGSRFTPTHAVKNDKRYRYYATQSGMKDLSNGSGPIRIPAQEIENLVVTRLTSFFGSSEELMGQLVLPSEDVATTRALIDAGKRWSKEFTASSVMPKRLLPSICERVVVGEELVELQLKSQSLKDLLLARTSAKDLQQPGSEVDKNATLVLAIPAALKRCGGEMRLIIRAGSPNEERPNTVPALVKAISRAHEWARQLAHGEHKHQRGIAAANGLDERYISRVLPSAFLAPDIVEAILEGMQAPELTLDKLLVEFSLGWPEQRRALQIKEGF